MISIDRFLNIRAAGGPSFSPDGRHVAFLTNITGLAQVWLVPVYRYALPEGVGPLQMAVQAIADGRIDVAMFTTGVQVVHLFQIAAEMKLDGEVRAGLTRAVIGSIGPTTSDQLREHGLAVDLQAAHPKFGLLVRELAERSGSLLGAKRRA